MGPSEGEAMHTRTRGIQEGTAHPDVALTTTTAVDAVAWGRAPRYEGSRVNLRVLCADGFAVSVQASWGHYAKDSHPSDEALYWRRDDGAAYPFVTFEVGNTTGDAPSLAEWDADGVWAWVPRHAVVDLLNAHGGAVGWEAPKE